MLTTHIQQKIIILSPLAADAARKLDVLLHHRNTLGMDGAQLGVLKETDQVGLGRLLQRQNSRRRKARRVFVLLRDLAH